MSDRAVVQGTYSDLKTVRSRGVGQLVIEFPIEQFEAVVRMLGSPTGDQWVAVAALQLGSGQVIEGKVTPPQKRTWDELSRKEQAGILCAEPRFQSWVHGNVHKLSHFAPENCAKAVRWKCGVTSRRELDENEMAGAVWDRLVREYRSSQ
jgi:hypothetical protein